MYLNRSKNKNDFGNHLTMPLTEKKIKKLYGNQFLVTLSIILVLCKCPPKTSV
jgi:hypothetical protein